MVDVSTVGAVGLAAAVLSVPLIVGIVPRNRLYGFRVPATLGDDRVWYAINRRVGAEMLIAGSALAALSIAFDEAGLTSGLPGAIPGIVMGAAVTALIVRGWRAANRMARPDPPAHGRPAAAPPR
jgi:uncharacterized membrane protein